MNIIKNTTPYIGKPFLIFEKYPEYIGKTLLNKIHINLGFTKLVSRIKPKYTKEYGREVDPSKVALIEAHTGGKIALYEWWTVKGVGENFESNKKPKNIEDILYHGTLPNSFLSKKGEYVGDIKKAWWYYKNNLRVCEDYPNGVAEVIKNDTLVGYYGYIHMVGQVFKIGDRLFTPKYKAKAKDYEEWEWAGYEVKFEELYNKEDDFGKEEMINDGIDTVIPFNRRGKKTIKDNRDCLRAAINMSKYLS